jgi:hypothetical protein
VEAGEVVAVQAHRDQAREPAAGTLAAQAEVGEHLAGHPGDQRVGDVQAAATLAVPREELAVGHAQLAGRGQEAAGEQRTAARVLPPDRLDLRQVGDHAPQPLVQHALPRGDARVVGVAERVDHRPRQHLVRLEDLGRALGGHAAHALEPRVGLVDAHRPLPRADAARPPIATIDAAIASATRPVSGSRAGRRRSWTKAAIGGGDLGGPGRSGATGTRGRRPAPPATRRATVSDAPVAACRPPPRG